MTENITPAQLGIRLHQKLIHTEQALQEFRMPNVEWDPVSSTLDKLRTLDQAVFDLEQARMLQVRRTRLRGASWQQIGDALSMSRQAAHQKYRFEENQ